MLNIAVMVSGGGTNLQALIDAGTRGELGDSRIVCVISNKDGVYALKRAEDNGIPTELWIKKSYPDEQARDDALIEMLERYSVDLVVLAGFLSILSKGVIERYRNRIINIHPSLIPSFCGKGFYGLRVHEAALAAGVKVTGATVHFVNEITDGGAIILQKAVEVKEDDTPETLQLRVMEQAEWILLPLAVRSYCEGRIRIENGRAYIAKD